MQLRILHARATARTALGLLLVALVACTSCGGGHEHGPAAGGGHDHAETPTLARTRFGAQTELFVEFPPLVVGQRSPFAAHLTRLSDFAPLAEGHVTVTLEPLDGAAGVERFEVVKAAQPGIFRPIALPRAAGRRRVRLRIESPGIDETHELGELEVFAAAAAASVGASEPEGEIALLKEQQWRIEFSTAPVALASLQPTRRLYGQLVTPPEGSVVLTAPASGRIASAELPAPGARLERDALVAEIAPALDTSTDRAGLQAAVQSAKLELAHAERELERARTLFAAGAIAERRVTEAQLAVDQAAVALREARRRSGQQSRALDTDGGNVAVRATVPGIVSRVHVVAGAAVEQGQPLLEIVDPEQLWLEARVPEHDLVALHGTPGGWFEVAGSATRFALAPAQRRGELGAVEAATRTAPLWFALEDASASALRPGMSAVVHLAQEPPVEVLAIPGDAIVHEAGQTLAFVQRSGESFERRVVRTGRRDGEHVEILDGLAAGERVVVDGAWIVKLAASGGAVPDHGHSH